MKRLLLAAFAATSLVACSSRHASKTTMSTTGSQTTTSSHAAFMVPSNIQTSFSTQYPDATAVTWAPYDVTVVPIDWDLTDWAVLSPQDYSVTYTMNGKKYYSWYSANGNWIGTTYDISDYNNGLPAAVNQTIASKYSGYTIDKANQVTWNDQTAYDLKLKNGDNKMKVLIDTNGNVLKQKDK
ncbi:MAG TPA: PepSY-like domain-containing protein [Flavisolibacter sp.]